MSVVKAVVHSEFLPPFVQGLRGCKISPKITNYFWSLGAPVPRSPNISKFRPAYFTFAPFCDIFPQNQICICYGFPWGLSTFLVSENCPMTPLREIQGVEKISHPPPKNYFVRFFENFYMLSPRYSENFVSVRPIVFEKKCQNICYSNAGIQQWRNLKDGVIILRLILLHTRRGRGNVVCKRLWFVESRSWAKMG